MAIEAKFTKQIITMEEGWVDTAVRELADRYGISRSAVVRDLIRAGLETVPGRYERERLARVGYAEQVRATLANGGATGG